MKHSDIDHNTNQTNKQTKTALTFSLEPTDVGKVRTEFPVLLQRVEQRVAKHAQVLLYL